MPTFTSPPPLRFLFLFLRVKQSKHETKQLPTGTRAPWRPEHPVAPLPSAPRALLSARCGHLIRRWKTWSVSTAKNKVACLQISYPIKKWSNQSLLEQYSAWKTWFKAILFYFNYQRDVWHAAGCSDFFPLLLNKDLHVHLSLHPYSCFPRKTSCFQHAQLKPIPKSNRYL